MLGRREHSLGACLAQIQIALALLSTLNGDLDFDRVTAIHRVF